MPGPIATVKDAADSYMRSAGLPYNSPKQYLKVDQERAGRIASAFEAMKHDPSDPATKASYAALAKEVAAQWETVKSTGLKIEFIKEGQPDPYQTSLRMAAMDLIANNHLWVFPTTLGFGSGTEGAAEAENDNPMLQDTGEVIDGHKMLVNDQFRIVHDYFGHFKEGVGFRADGEENAWRAHAAMFTPPARAALTSETRGQNSWLNFGPPAEHNRTASPADTIYAPQKVGVMPEWTSNEGRLDPGKTEKAFDPDEPRDERGRWTSGGSSSDYASASPSTPDKADHVAAVYTLNAKGKEAAEETGRTPLTFHALTPDGNERFHAAITAAKASSKFGAAVHAYEADEYRNTRMFVTPDDMAGFTLKPDGDIASAFKHGESKAVDAGDSMLALAVQQGGRKLDAFDTILPELYSHNGFRAVSRLPWNDKEAPPGWDKKTFKKFNAGKPDVVFMVYDPDHAKPYKAGDGKLAKSYDEAVAAQDRALAEIAGKSEHPGEGYSASARLIGGVIHTSNVYDAQRALFENRRVDLKQLKQVSTLIKRLGETAAEMAEHGETAPVFNLCNVSVEGTNLFCAENKGIPRVEMPVIPAKRTKEFIKYLKSRGYTVEKDNEQARNLRATQNEISGTKVAAAMARIKAEGFYKRLVVSRDDYIVDGHHTWAGQLGLDAKDGKLKDDKRSVKIARVDIPIIKLIEEAETFTGGAGKKPATEAPKMFAQMTLASASRMLPPVLFRKYYVAACEFFDANAHIPRAIMRDLVVVVRAAPLYVRRDLQNVEAFTAWAQAQGFDEVADDLHVTVLYSKTPVDWDDMGDRDTDMLVVPAGGERSLEVLGDDAVALVFASTALARRHGEMLGDGASSDYDAYVPHVTINLSGVIPEGAVPYDGELIFGSEIFETIDTEEKEFDPDKHPRVPAGSPEGGQFGSGGGETSPEGDDANFDPAVIQVGGDAWNQATARRLEREYQAAKPALDKITNGAVKESELVGQLNKQPHEYVADWNALSAEQQDAVYAQWKKEHEGEYKNTEELAAAWDEMTDAERGEIAEAQIVASQADDQDEDEGPIYPDEWDVMSGDQQSETEEHWKKNNYSSVHDSEVENWSSEQAPDDARGQVSEEFNDGDETEWAEDALKELRELEEFPFTDEQLIKAMKINYETGSGGGSYWQKQKDLIEFDDKMLNEIKIKEKEGEGQGTFAGIEAPDYSKLLTDDMRASITTAMINAMDDRADKVVDDMQPPDYLGESVDEYLDMQWGEMSDNDKFQYAYDNDIVEKPPSESSDTPSKPSNPWKVEALPSTYDPLNETTGADYLRTQRLARYLSIYRARQVVVERGLRETYPDVNRMAAIDNAVWSAWKASSTSIEGQLLQVATAEELGGRLNARTATGLDIDGVKKMADGRYADIGGYKGVLAYLRAKWETTQYLLDKAGDSELELYRGLDLGRHDKDRFDAALKEKGARAKQMIDVEYGSGSKNQYTKLPTVKVDRNGAASTTTDITVANGWAGGGAGKITLRAVVPRTAAISIPAYGINVHGEHEVVVAGVAWKAWDAWAGTAPPLDKLPIGKPGTGIGTNAPMQQAA